MLVAARNPSTFIRLASHYFAPHPHITLRRGYVDQSQSSPTRFQSQVHSPENVQNEFAQHTMTAFKDMRKVVLFLAYGTLIVGTISGVIFEATHFWIEGKMREAADEDAQRWGWEVEGWSDPKTGGTSSTLGFWGRHSVRAAWFSLRYAKYFTTTTTISQLGSQRAEEGSLNFVDASLENARVYLEQAMAPMRDEQGHVPSDSIGLELLERHAAVLERLGTTQSLLGARDEYLQVFRGHAGYPHINARLAVKLGDLSERLGDEKEALFWWAMSIDLTKDRTFTSSVPKSSSIQSVLSSNSQAAPNPLASVGKLPVQTASPAYILPDQPPASPVAQRTLVAAMLSLSAYFSKRQRFQEAQTIQVRAIHLIDAMIPRQEASPSAPRDLYPPAQTLHHMYLLHRRSLLWLHHGEVTFALASFKTRTGKAPPHAALIGLLTAAASTEVVAQILTGLPLLHPDMPLSYLGPKKDPASTALPIILHPPSPDSPLLPAYRDSSALSAPARSILRDARLAAVEAWDLCGVLYSDLGGADNDSKALDCFERALGWVGDPSQGGSREGMSVKGWEALWARFVEAREKVINKKPK